uniref:Superfamily II DNA/RNA helicase n=1 Tax=Mycena chlorophos TaxID=658473 RepID=A0ABQ0KTU4_MYCCL|nr:superfamily II DNA/RNA helicase [Mycena chlorophos]
MQAQGNQPGLIRIFKREMEAWAHKHQNTADGKAILAWLPNFKERPFYTASELVPLFPTLARVLGIVPYIGGQKSSLRLSNELHFAGLPVLQNVNGTSKFIHPMHSGAKPFVTEFFISIHSQADFCRAGCTSPRGARFWEEQGLLGDVARGETGIRRYTDEQMEKARIIAAAQFGGFPLEQIKDMLAVYHSDAEVHDALLQRLEDQVRAASRLGANLPKPRIPAGVKLEYDLTFWAWMGIWKTWKAKYSTRSQIATSSSVQIAGKMGGEAVKVYRSKESGLYVLEGPADKAANARHMAYRGLAFSLSASSREKSVLFSDNPYSVCDLAAANDPDLGPYRRAIDFSRAETSQKKYPTPPGKELWDYQAATLDYLLARGGGIDADEPGLGKTPTSIVFCNAVEARRVLVIVPASVRIQWGQRIKEWSTIPNVHVSVMLKVKDGIHPTCHYQVISYEAARNPAIMRAIGHRRWDVLICDEAHKMKSADAIVTRAILGNRDKMFVHGETKIPCIGSYCDKAIALTGTPLLNRPSECYVLFRYFDWESIDFCTEDGFKERYNKQADLKTIEGKRFKLESTSLELELQNRLRVNIMARHEKKDVLQQMKVPRYSLVTCSIDGGVSSALAVEGMLGLDIEQIQTTKEFEILGHISEARRLMGEALAPQVIDFVSDFLDGSDEKYVLFGWHLSVLSLYEAGLAQYGTEILHGGKSARARQSAIDEFISNPKKRVFIANIQAGGEGVDGLQTVASRCGLGEPDWVPSRNEQAVSRVDRFGQQFQVQADLFVAPGSIAEKILVRSLEKMNVIHRVLDEKENRT